MLIPGTLNWFVGTALFSPCLVAVNTFVLITGYYMSQQRFRLSKVALVWSETVFYSVTIYLIWTVATVGLEGIALIPLIKCFLPMTQEKYWFVSDYLLLLMLSPALNCFTRELDRKTYLRCIFCAALVLCILPNLPIYSYDIALTQGGFSLSWFCVLYITAGYLRKYAAEWSHPGRCFLGTTMFIALMHCLSYYAPITRYMGSWVTYNSLTCYLGAASLFQFFRKIKIEGQGTARLIQFATQGAFAVYLLHKNKEIEGALWGWFNFNAENRSPLMLPHIIVCVCAISAACVCVDWIRRKVIDLTGWKKLVISVSGEIEALAERLLLRMEAAIIR